MQLWVLSLLDLEKCHEHCSSDSVPDTTLSYTLKSTIMLQGTLTLLAILPHSLLEW
jgi:hypothetical protein